MKDKAFIEEMVRKGEEAREKFRSNFSNLSLTQLNWKPSPESWSIGQCLDHLLVADCLYFPMLKKITEGNYHMSFWEKWSPFGKFMGHMLVTQVQEQPRRKMNAPKIFLPSTSNIDAGIYERFSKHLDTLLEYIALCKSIDVDKTRITSPVSKFITYNLRDAFRLLIQHEHRHLNQALRVKQHKNFLH